MSIVGSKTTAPFMNNVGVCPLMHYRCKVIGSNSKKLCTMVDNGITNSSSGHASTHRSSLIKNNDAVTRVRQGSCGGESGYSGTDNNHTHFCH
jgi:hypothetical protein